MKKLSVMCTVFIVLFSMSLFANDKAYKEFEKLEKQFIQQNSKMQDDKLPKEFNCFIYEYSVVGYSIGIDSNKPEKNVLSEDSPNGFTGKEGVDFYLQEGTGTIPAIDGKMQCEYFKNDDTLYYTKFSRVLKAKNTKYIEYWGKRFPGTWYRVSYRHNGKNFVNYISISNGILHLLGGIDGESLGYVHTKNKILKMKFCQDYVKETEDNE